jgi:hypothetical protein
MAAVMVRQGFDPEGALFPELERIFGRMDFRGRPRPFTVSDYYEEEMGPALERFLVAFEPLDSPTGLVRAKLETAAVEKEFLEGDLRTVNIDPGFMDFHKIVLASFKHGPQKIYLGDGVYADPVMMFQHGAFVSLSWTFPDFKAGFYDGDLKAVRRIYRDARRMLADERL